MALVLQIEKPDLHIYVWKMTESVVELAKIGGTTVSEVGHLTRWCEKQTQMLMMKSFLPNKQLVYRQNGRPYLKESNLHITFSHSKELLGMAVADFEIGIDIEHIDRSFSKIAHKYLSHGEPQQFHSAKDMCLCWCFKESVFKAIDGLTHNFWKDVWIEKIVDNHIIGWCGNKKIEGYYHQIGENFIMIVGKNVTLYNPF